MVGIRRSHRRGPGSIPGVGIEECFFNLILSVAEMGPLHDSVTWYEINYARTQVTQWDFQNKEKSGLTGTMSFVLEVARRYLCLSIIYAVPCDRIVQRAYWPFTKTLRKTGVSEITVDEETKVCVFCF